MGKDNELREWALNHWKVYRAKYTGEVKDLEMPFSENLQQHKLEKPFSFIPKKTIKSMMLMFEIPRIKVEIARGEEERAKVGSDPGLIWELKQNRALLAMIKGYCKWGTNESVIKALDKHLSKKKSGQKKDHTLIIWEVMQSLENDLKKEAKPTKIWNYLRKNIKKYNSNGVIISISHDEMKYFESNGTEGHITKESFRHAIKRLRENPPKKTVTCPDM
jgi:phosphopantetheinyl transferase (holo-ACP synthase)